MTMEINLMPKDHHITKGSDNIFHDLGFDPQEAEELLLQADLFNCLEDAIRTSSLSKPDLARILGSKRSAVSKILRGKIEDFSLDQIMSYLLRLGFDLTIDVRQNTAKNAQGRAIVNRLRATKSPTKDKA
jgi:predicted XRE-type DNA-binding protein